MKNLRQQDMFGMSPTNSGSSPVILELKGLGAVPNFKNSKRVMAWLDKLGKVLEFFKGHWWVRKDTIRIRNTLLTLPEHKAWMDAAIMLLESQLRSVFQTAGVEIQTDALARSKIALYVPLDDCWTQCPEITVRSMLVPEGQEGATIEITRLT